MQPRQSFQSSHLSQSSQTFQQSQLSQPAVLQNSVVVFSKNYLPISRVNLKRAAVLLVTGQAEPFDFGTQVWEIRSVRFVLQVPEHIRLTSGNPERQWKVPPVNRREIFRRDNHTCQYCGTSKRLTLDHVIPKSKGGTHTWDNVVAACETCNSRKGDLAPLEVGLILKTKPKPPIHPAIAFAEHFWKTNVP